MRPRIPVALRGQPVPDQKDRIHPGQAVRARDVRDVWHDAVATTGVVYGHDFEIVWIRMPNSYGSQDVTPFPAGDVVSA